MEDNSPIRLYHYTKVDTLLRYILPEMRLRMNALANTNDPTETLWSLIEDEDNHESRVYEILSQVKSLSLCSNSKNQANMDSFISGFEIHPMWAHYAENWGGVCLEIDYGRFLEINKSQLDKFNIRGNYIEYVDCLNRESFPRKWSSDSEGIPDETFAQNLLLQENVVSERFFKKDHSWSYEHEYRFVATQGLDEEIHLKLDGAIKNILLGPKFNIHLYPAVRELVQKKSIEIDIIQKIYIDEQGYIGHEYKSYEKYYVHKIRKLYGGLFRM